MDYVSMCLKKNVMRCGFATISVAWCNNINYLTKELAS